MKKILFSSLFIVTAFITKAQVILDPALAPFYHGVASGDPTPSGVIIWTRVTDALQTTIAVSWRVATDSLFANVVASGSATATAAHDYTVKADVTGLAASKWYYYQFSALGKYSLTGRTKTLPPANSTAADSVRLAVVSCANYESGFYNAYEAIKQRNDVDVVIELGDYIYEYGQGQYDYNATANRHVDPAHECITQADYRARHSQAKLDPQLRHLHQQFPFICVWDDHEVADNAYKNGADNHDPATEGLWATRRDAGLSAYIDWMPVRQPDPTGEPLRLYRQFAFGNLIDLYMLDTRFEGRDQSVSYGSATYNDTSRTMMGITQRNWLFNNFNSATRTWQMIGQQIMVAPLKAFGVPVNMDQWDGFPAERNRLYSSMQQNSSKNFVILSGDIHSAWANDLPLSGYGIFSRNKSAGVEFITTSVTSPFTSISTGLIQLFNSHVRYVNGSKGFMIMNITKTKVQGDWYYVSTISQSTATTSFGDGWYVNKGEKFMRHASGATSRPLAQKFPFAPSNPMTFPRLAEETSTVADQFVVLGVYPNPVHDQLKIQFYNEVEMPLHVSVYNMQGQQVFNETMNNSQGLNMLDIPTSSLSAGAYSLLLETPAKKLSKQFTKEN